MRLCFFLVRKSTSRWVNRTSVRPSPGASVQGRGTNGGVSAKKLFQYPIETCCCINYLGRISNRPIPWRPGNSRMPGRPAEGRVFRACPSDPVRLHPSRSRTAEGAFRRLRAGQGERPDGQRDSDGCGCGDRKGRGEPCRRAVATGRYRRRCPMDPVPGGSCAAFVGRRNGHQSMSILKHPSKRRGEARYRPITTAGWP